MAIARLLNEMSYDPYIVSVKNTVDRMENGNLVTANTLVANERELYTAGKVTSVITDIPVMVIAPDGYEMDNGMRLPIYDPRNVSYPKNKPLRAYRLKKDMQFLIQTSAITGTPVEGQFIVGTNNAYTMSATATAPTSASHKVAFVVERTGIFESVGTELVPVIQMRVVLEA